MARPNVQAIYDQRQQRAPGPVPAGVNKFVRRNSRQQKLAAYATIPRDDRAPAVVAKADEDLNQQKQEMGDDVPTNDPQADAARPAADSDQAARSEPQPAGAEAAPADASPADAVGKDAEPLSDPPVSFEPSFPEQEQEPAEPAPAPRLVKAPKRARRG